jgi:hypothetical protein
MPDVFERIAIRNIPIFANIIRRNGIITTNSKSDIGR